MNDYSKDVDFDILIKAYLEEEYYNLLSFDEFVIYWRSKIKYENVLCEKE